MLKHLPWGSKILWSLLRRIFSRKIIFSALRWFVVLFLLHYFPAELYAAPAGNSSVELTILYVNDLHGHILPQRIVGGDRADAQIPVGGSAHLARMIDDERRKNPEGTLLLAAGDLFQGTPISNIFHGRPVLEVLNALRFDATAVGNHEFDWGYPKLLELASAARFPFLAANIVYAKGGTPSGLSADTIIQRKGLQIALIGLTTPDTPFSTKPGNVKGLSFRNPKDVLQRSITTLRARGADLIFVLSHLGLDEDRTLARSTPGIDVIVGGHSHTAVFEPVEVNHTLIVQAKSYAEYLGVLKLKIDKASKTIVGHNRQVLKKNLSGPEDPFDPAIDRLVQDYHARIKEEFGAIIGETRVDLTRSFQGESLLGDLVCDAVRQAAGADIAFQNVGGIRANLPAGKITLEQVFTVLPFDNQLIAMSLTGAQIRDILERSLHHDGSVGLQISGVRVTYDMQRPAGARAVDVVVGGRPLEPERIYRVATNDFLAAGGDRFGYFKEGRDIVSHGDFRDAVTDYLRENSPVAPQLEGRIRIMNVEQAGAR